MEQHDIERGVADLGAEQPWNHNFRLPFNVETRPGNQISHGKNLVKWQRIEPLLDMIDVAGKSVLDVGANEGFFSFSMAEKGASVLGVDIDEKRLKKAKFVREVKSATDIEFKRMDVYSEEFRSLPRFDVVVCLGVLHRVPDPFRLLAELCGKADIILLEWKSLKFGDHDQAFGYFSDKPIDVQDYYGTEYWILSFEAVERMLVRSGMRRFHRVDDPRQRRGILIAGKVDNPIFDQPDVRVRRNRARTVLSHMKRFARVMSGILRGDINN